MKAIGKNIVVRKVGEEVKTKSGVLLSAEEVDSFRYKKAEVVLVGSDVNGIAAGDIIYYDNARAYTLVIEGENATIIQERDVVVVL